MRALTVLFVMAIAGCVHGARMAGTVAPLPDARPSLPLPCFDCDSVPMPREIATAIEARIGDLAERGGDCATYGAVLEQSYRAGRVVVRPFMWRVDTHLTSGEAHLTGEIAFAQEIDSLNVGVRTIGEMTWTAEHEAAHIAFHIPSHGAADEARVNAHVRACRPAAPVSRSTNSKG